MQSGPAATPSWKLSVRKGANPKCPFGQMMLMERMGVVSSVESSGLARTGNDYNARCVPTGGKRKSREFAGLLARSL
jgi:hypothetical protein